MEEQLRFLYEEELDVLYLENEINKRLFEKINSLPVEISDFLLEKSIKDVDFLELKEKKRKKLIKSIYYAYVVGFIIGQNYYKNTIKK
jgi:hypothetical protein